MVVENRQSHQDVHAPKAGRLGAGADRGLEANTVGHGQVLDLVHVLGVTAAAPDRITADPGLALDRITHVVVLDHDHILAIGGVVVEVSVDDTMIAALTTSRVSRTTATISSAAETVVVTTVIIITGNASTIEISVAEAVTTAAGFIIIVEGDARGVGSSEVAVIATIVTGASIEADRGIAVVRSAIVVNGIHRHRQNHAKRRYTINMFFVIIVLHNTVGSIPKRSKSINTAIVWAVL